MNDEQACRQAYDDFYHKVRAEVGYDHWVAIWRFIRKRRGEPVAWRVHPFDYGVGYEGAYALTSRPDQAAAWERKGWEVQPLFTAPQSAEPVNLDRYDAGFFGGQDGMPAYVWHDIIRAELDRAYEFYMDQLDRATLQSHEIQALRAEIGRLLDSREREGDRLDWLLARLPGSVIRDLVGVMNDTLDAGEWRDLIDKAACFAPVGRGREA